MPTRFTIAQLQKLQADGKIRGFADRKPDHIKLVKLPPVEPEGLRYLKQALTAAAVIWTAEHRFHPVRRWRFDIAIPDKLIGLEYEGLFSEKSRHTTAKGYTADAEKYNTAQSMGWRVFRYTAMNYKNIDLDIRAIL